MVKLYSFDEGKFLYVRLTRRMPLLKCRLASDSLIPRNVFKQERKIERTPTREIHRAAMTAAKYLHPGNRKLCEVPKIGPNRITVIGNAKQNYAILCLCQLVQFQRPYMTKLYITAVLTVSIHHSKQCLGQKSKPHYCCTHCLYPSFETVSWAEVEARRGNSSCLCSRAAGWPTQPASPPT